jgi:hypothetical protein
MQIRTHSGSQVALDSLAYEVVGEKDTVWPVIYEEVIQAGGVNGLTYVYESLIEPLAQCGKQG